MSADENEVKANLTNELAKERNRAAYDRTLMAWIRTAISLIGFGFAIAKSYEYIQMDEMEKTGRFIDQIHAPLWFGMSFIVLGMLCILGGVIQYCEGRQAAPVRPVHLRRAPTAGKNRCADPADHRHLRAHHPFPATGHAALRHGGLFLLEVIS